MASEYEKKFQKQYVNGYQITDMDTQGDPSYYGYVNADGEWYIMKMSIAENAFRYARGLSDYETNWTERAELSYGYFYDIF